MVQSLKKKTNSQIFSLDFSMWTISTKGISAKLNELENESDNLP